MNAPRAGVEARSSTVEVAVPEQQLTNWSQWRSRFLNTCAERHWDEAVRLVQSARSTWPQAAAVLEAALGVTLAAEQVELEPSLLAQTDRAAAQLAPVWQGFVHLAQEDTLGAQKLFEASARAVQPQTSPVVLLLTRVGLGRVLLERSVIEPHLAQQAAAWYADALWMYGEASPAEWWCSYAYALAAAGKLLDATRVLSWRLSMECERIDRSVMHYSDADDAYPHPDTLLGLWVCLRALEAPTHGPSSEAKDTAAARAVAEELLREAFVLYPQELRIRNAIVHEHRERAFRFLGAVEPDTWKAATHRAAARTEYLLGRWRERRGDWIEAETHYGTSIQHWTEMAVARLALAYSLLRRNAFDQAMDQIERVRQQGSRALPARLDAYLRALSAVILQEKAADEQASRKALEQAQQHALELLQGTDLEQLPAEALAVYAELMDRLDPAFALQLYSRLGKHWDDPIVWNNIAALRVRLGQYNEAYIALERALQLVTGDQGLSLRTWLPEVAFIRKRPWHLTLSYNLGRLLELLGDLTRSESIYRTIHEQFPEYEDATLRLGVLAEHLHRNLNTAEDLYRQVLPNPRAVTALAFLAQSRGRVDEAQAWFEYFIRRKKLRKDLETRYQARNYCDLVTAAYYVTLARATARHHQSRRHKFLVAAGNLLLGVLERAHDNVAAMQLLGVYFREMNLLSEAEEALCAVAQLGAVASAEPKIMECARANLIAVHLSRGSAVVASLRNAIRLLDDRLQTAPYDAGALMALAAAHYGLGQYAACMETLQRALHLQPSALSVWFDLSLTLAQESSIRLSRPDHGTDPEVATVLLECAGGCFRAIEMSLRQMQRSVSTDVVRQWQPSLAGPTNKVVTAEAAHANSSWCLHRLAYARRLLAEAQERTRRRHEELQQRQQQREAAAARQADAVRQRREVEQREIEELEKLAREQQLEFCRRQEEWEAQRGKSRSKSQVLVELQGDLEDKSGST